MVSDYEFFPEKVLSAVPRQTPSGFWDLICQCCLTEPSRRPSFDDVVERLKQMKSHFKETLKKKKVCYFYLLL